MVHFEIDSRLASRRCLLTAHDRFGDYQQEPEEPEVGSPAYPPSIYGTWDPNWRAFVGTTFIIAIEEFESLLSNATVDYMLASLRNATIGDTYRVGGVDGDNYYASYSNPVSLKSIQVLQHNRSTDPDVLARQSWVHSCRDGPVVVSTTRT